MDNGKAVIFIFLKNNQILLEKRTFSEKFVNQLVFPGGTAEVDEHENLELTLQREVQEELGVRATRFEELNLENDFKSRTGKIITPYIIHDWEGEIPKIILDQGNEVIWVDIKDAINSPLSGIQFIANALVQHLENGPS